MLAANILKSRHCHLFMLAIQSVLFLCFEKKKKKILPAFLYFFSTKNQATFFFSELLVISAACAQLHNSKNKTAHDLNGTIYVWSMPTIDGLFPPILESRNISQIAPYYIIMQCPCLCAYCKLKLWPIYIKNFAFMYSSTSLACLTIVQFSI